MSTELKRVTIYPRFERLWHWGQALLIIFLAITGFEIHGTIAVFGFEKAVVFHRFASYALLALIAFAIFWHLTSGEWKQYIPTTSKLFAQIRYYAIGIFKGEDHPDHKSERNKLNPLQRLTYLGFKITIIPIVVISGLIYLFHKSIDQNNIVVISEFSLDTVAIIHTLGAFLLIAFLVVHVYMTTTGETPLSNIKSMLLGYEEFEVETADHKKEKVL